MLTCDRMHRGRKIYRGVRNNRTPAQYRSRQMPGTGAKLSDADRSFKAPRDLVAKFFKEMRPTRTASNRVGHPSSRLLYVQKIDWARHVPNHRLPRNCE